MKLSMLTRAKIVVTGFVVGVALAMFVLKESVVMALEDGDG